MEITEQGLYEAFGVTPEATQAGEPQNTEAGTAESPAAQNGTETGGGQATALHEESGEKTSDDTQGQREHPSDAGTDGDAGRAETSEQSQDERREHAAQRRRQEQQAAIDKAVQEALKAEREKMDGQWKDFFQRAGLKNTLDNTPITTKAEFDAWAQAFDRKKMERDLSAGRLTPETIEQLIEKNPTVQRAQEIIRQQESAQKQQQDAAAQARIEQEIREIHAINPKINSAQDILDMDTGEAFYGYVQKGLSFRDAYYLANREQIDQSRQQAAWVQAQLNQRGKEHMVPAAAARGAGSQSVPAEDLRWFRTFNPNATDAEIEKYYNKNRK